MHSYDDITVQIIYTPPSGVGDPVVFESTSDTGITLINGVTGIGIAPVTHTTVARAQSHGSVLRSTRLTEREIFLPILMDAESVHELDKLRDSLLARLDPLKGPGTLTIRRMADGQVRTIPAIYKDGLAGDYGSEYYGEWQSFGLTFLVTEAFFSGEKMTVKWALESISKPFISTTERFFPVILGRTSTDNNYSLTVPGDVTTYPVWRITGPATDPTITNERTGEKFSFTGEIRAGETITIDSKNNTLLSNQRTQEELWDALSLDSIIFALEPGETGLSVTATSLTAASAIEASFSPQYLAGY